MSWKIVADSSCDLHNGIPCEAGVSFSIAPLKIRVGDTEFVDDINLDLPAMRQMLQESKGPSSSSCPSPEEWAAEFVQADNTLAVTMTSTLSGTYNSALVAKDLVLEAHPEKKIHVLDTLATGGHMALLVLKINELIGQGLDFEHIAKAADDYNNGLELLFTLGGFENLIKNGRMNRIVGSIATTLNIRVVGRASDDGKLELLHKTRGQNRVLEMLVTEMAKWKDPRNLPIVISHCCNLPGAQQLEKLIQAAYEGVRITIMETHGLTTYYSEEGGLLVAF